MRLFGPSLLVELEPGLFIRPLGLSAVEVGIIRPGMFEPETVRAFAALLAPGMTVLDVGANVGLFTLVAAHGSGPPAGSHAFEPTPELAAHILRNLELNGLENVTVNEIAVSDVAGRATLHLVEPDDPGENSIVNPVPGCRTLEVPTVTLDGYIAEHAVGRVDVIKIDIEGAEMPALRGAGTCSPGTIHPCSFWSFTRRRWRSAATVPTICSGCSTPTDTRSTRSRCTACTHPTRISTGSPRNRGTSTRFPALRRWQQQPLSSWDPAILKTLEYLPLE